MMLARPGLSSTYTYAKRTPYKTHVCCPVGPGLASPFLIRTESSRKLRLAGHGCARPAGWAALLRADRVPRRTSEVVRIQTVFSDMQQLGQRVQPVRRVGVDNSRGKRRVTSKWMRRYS